jgi:mono/diheme cytochrome c family protein
MTTPARIGVVALLGLGLVVAGCGGGDDDNDTTTAAAPATSAPTATSAATTAETMATEVTSATGETSATGDTSATGESSAAESSGAGSGATSGAAADGQAIFTANCASCHTLAAANATGNVGPNLDQLDVDQATVEKQVTNGGGVMPAFGGQLTSDEIKAVAAYVVENRSGG